MAGLGGRDVGALRTGKLRLGGAGLGGGPGPPPAAGGLGPRLDQIVCPRAGVRTRRALHPAGQGDRGAGHPLQPGHLGALSLRDVRPRGARHRETQSVQDARPRGGLAPMVTPTLPPPPALRVCLVLVSGMLLGLALLAH